MTPTAEQIRNEPFGRTMRGWVAEYVMNWALVNPEEGAAHWIENCGDGCIILRHAREIDWKPDLDISEAFEVVEKMRDEHHVIIEGHWQGGWKVQFTRPSEEFESLADELPLAICRAALLSVLPTKDTDDDTDRE